MDDGLLVGLVITFMALAAGLATLFAALRYRTKVLEFRHAERLAMIERGLVPSPEMSGVDVDPPGLPHEAAVRGRSLSLGIIVVGFGCALMFLVGIAGGAPESGIGLGGAVAILGVAFIVRSVLVRQRFPEPARRQPAMTPPPGTPLTPSDPS